MPTNGISCVLTTYNQPFVAVKRSIDSVLQQCNVDAELIVTDDCSNQNLVDSIQNYASSMHAHIPIVFKCNSTNIKTVLNTARGVESARYDIVKTIDAGDTFYDSATLKTISDFMSTHECRAGFGQIYRFRKSAGKAFFDSYNAPRQPERYSLNGDHGSESLMCSQLMSGDWIPAPAQFYNTDLYYSLLKKLNQDYNVLYCQDFTATLALQSEPMLYLPQPIYWYEWGVGISTNGGMDSRKRLYKDHHNFYEELANEYSLDSRFKKAYNRFRLREFVAIKSPFYSPLLRISSLLPTVKVNPNEHLLSLLKD